MKKIQFNLNVNKEDFNTNDYIYVWEYFQERPSKIIIYENFEQDKFSEVLKKYNYSEECSLVELIPIENDTLLNKRILVKLDDNLFVSYTSFDSDTTESFTNDIYLYFNKKGSDSASKFIEELNNILDEEDENEISEKSNLYSLTFETTGFEEREIVIKDVDDKNIDLYYTKSVNKKISKLLKSLKKNKKGLTLIHGERGVGKTSLIKYISKKIKKKCFFIPCSSFETTIINPDFRNFLSKNTESVLILDDSDIYFSEIYSKSNIFTNILLQLVDGLDSDTFNLQIISILNVGNVDEIDHSLMDCNNLIDIIEVDELSSDKIDELSKHLGRKVKNKNASKLSQIFRNFQHSDDKSELGF